VIISSSSHYRVAGAALHIPPLHFHLPDFFSKQWKIIGGHDIPTDWISNLKPIGILFENNTSVDRSEFENNSICVPRHQKL
jgi:hypothetical protein